MSGGADGIVGMAFEANHFSHNAEAAATYVNVTCAGAQCATGDFVGCGESLINAVHSARHGVTNMQRNRSSGHTDFSWL